MMGRISEILNDPVQAEKIKQLASSLMPDSKEKSPVTSETFTQPKQSAPISSISDTSFPLGDMAQVMKDVSGFLNKTSIMKNMPSSEAINKDIALLNAIKPYMRQTRADRIGSAVKAMQVLATIAKLK